MNKKNTVAKAVLVAVAMFAVAACFTNTANADGTWVKDFNKCKREREKPCNRWKYYEFTGSKSDKLARKRAAETIAAKHKGKKPPVKDVTKARTYCRKHGMGQECSNYNQKKDSLIRPQKRDHNPKTELLIAAEVRSSSAYTAEGAMDNATLHKRGDTQEAIKNAGHGLLCLPPCSPDLKPH